ncbi:MAG TPA: head GIN domain-containing protein [Puia sp.]|nr:head GIN domain-containing protein [Puia sp.]
MKTLKIAFLAFFAIAAVTGRTFAQSEETRSVSGFNGLATGSSFAVHVKIDGTESLRLKGSPEDLRRIETVVEHGVLKIRLPRSHDWDDERIGHVDVYVSAKSLSLLEIGGSGSIDVEGVVKGDKVSVSVGGSGGISTAVESSDLHVSIAGSGNVKMSGKSGDAKISVAGSGSLKAADLKVDEAEIGIAGSGDVRLEVEKTISAHIAGSGSVLYTGNATISNVSSAGSGRVSRVK